MGKKIDYEAEPECSQDKLKSSNHKCQHDSVGDVTIASGVANGSKEAAVISDTTASRNKREVRIRGTPFKMVIVLQQQMYEKHPTAVDLSGWQCEANIVIMGRYSQKYLREMAKKDYAKVQNRRDTYIGSEALAGSPWNHSNNVSTSYRVQSRREFNVLDASEYPEVLL